MILSKISLLVLSLIFSVNSLAGPSDKGPQEELNLNSRSGLQHSSGRDERDEVEVAPLTGSTIKINEKYSLALAVADGFNNIDDLSATLITMIQNAQPNEVIDLVFEPTNDNVGFYDQLYARIESELKIAKEQKNVNLKMLTLGSELYLEILSHFKKNHPAGQENMVELKQSRPLILEVGEVPPNLVERINRRTTLASSMWGTVKDVGIATKDGIKNIKWGGLAVATVIAYNGGTALGESYVYVSNGEWSKESILTLAMTTALLYSIPRNEKLTRSLYYMGYEFARSGLQVGKYLNSRFNPWAKKSYHVEEPNPHFQNNFNVFAGTVLYSIPIQMAFFYLQDGTAVWNPETMEHILKNSVLLGAASAPWSFAAQKLKENTKFSESLITTLRTAHLLALYPLAMAGIPYGIGADFFSISTPEEFALVASGAIGVAANQPKTIRILNNISQNPKIKWLNENFQAIADFPRTFLSNIFSSIAERARAGRSNYGITRFTTNRSGQAESQNQCLTFLMN